MTLPISVVIPTYNTPTEQLQRAIESAMNAGANDIHVVSDGSDDDFDIEQAYPEFLKNGSSVYLHYIPRSGVCAARNYGIKQASGGLIVPLDADDELLPDGLRALYDAEDGFMLIYGGWYEVGQNFLPDETITNFYREPPPPEMLARKNVAHATWLFNYDDWRRVGGYDPDFNIGGEDYAFMIALVNAGVKPIRVDVPIYRKHIREGSRTAAARSRYPFIQQLLREKYPTFFSS